ncbi:hypothetical protein [Paraburkholderia youngii]|uniref:hypothetical protein n=1 Tax=Paraburkholderia youngii TaxID=2782701 RepID=UPI003D22C1A3
MVLRLLSPDQIDDTEILCRNRLIMLNYQKMNRGRPDAALSEAIVKACAVGCTLFNLEQRFDAFEPTLVRAVVFSLVLAGALNCPTLAAQPLGRETYLVAR